jgi:hypothetical protein
VTEPIGASPAWVLIAGWIRIIATCGPAVVWGCHCGADGNGTQRHATAHVSSTINAAAMDASYADSADTNPPASPS